MCDNNHCQTGHKTYYHFYSRVGRSTQVHYIQLVQLKIGKVRRQDKNGIYRVWRIEQKQLKRKTSTLGILNMISIIEPSRGDIVSTERLIWKLIYKKQGRSPQYFNPIMEQQNTVYTQYQCITLYIILQLEFSFQLFHRTISP